ncbi:MAG: pyridoxamine 5'-phosphate oxidase family protein [Candidatus Shapirobacteria bacterium]|jgi:hypothetical protein
MNLNDLKESIESSILALATSTPDGRPNCIAVACCKVISDNQVLISDNFFNKTRQNLLINSQVSVAFWDPEDNPAGNRGYQLKGVAQYLTQGKWKQIVDADPDNEGLAHKAAVLVTVTEIWDLANPKLLFKQEV